MKQLSRFWNGIVENQSHYYIGNLVVIDKMNANAESHFQIIDGQQRITTLSLLVIALRNFIEKDKIKSNIFPNLRHQDIIEDLNTILYKTSSFDNGEITYKLRFRKENLNEIYQELARGEKTSHLELEDLDDNQKRFKRNLQILTSFLKEYFKNSEQKTKSLELLIDKIKKIEFILIVCESDSNAYKLFEGLNSTGLELSVVDLVKNSVFLSVNELNPSSLSKIENTWQEIENIFENYDINRLPKFLRHQWIANEGYINTSELYDKIKDEKLSGTYQSILSYVENLRTDAKSYVGLKTGDQRLLDKKLKAKYNRIIESIKRFSWLDAEQVYAVLLAYYKKHLNNKNYTSKMFLRDIERLWNFSFLIGFIDISPSQYEKIFADRCRAITKYSGKSFNVESNKFYALLSEMTRGKESDFVSNFSSDFTYSKTNSDLIRYVLQQYLWSGESKNVKAVRKDEPSIEHILPQTPDKWGKTKVEIGPYVHRIGNLTLLGDSENGSISSDTFKSKYEKLYKKDIYPKNKKLKEWENKFGDNPDLAIEERGNEIAKIVYKLFEV